MIHSATFLSATGNLMRAFSMHEKKGKFLFLPLFMISDRLFSKLITFSYISNYGGFIELYFLPTSNELFTVVSPCNNARYSCLLRKRNINALKLKLTRSLMLKQAFLILMINVDPLSQFSTPTSYLYALDPILHVPSFFLS